MVMYHMIASGVGLGANTLRICAAYGPTVCAGCAKDDSIEFIKKLSYCVLEMCNFCPKAQRQETVSVEKETARRWTERRARIPRPGRNLASLFLSNEVGLMQVLLGLLGAISLQVPYMSISSLFVSRNRDFMGVLVG